MLLMNSSEISSRS